MLYVFVLSQNFYRHLNNLFWYAFFSIHIIMWLFEAKTHTVCFILLIAGGMFVQLLYTSKGWHHRKQYEEIV